MTPTQERQALLQRGLTYLRARAEFLHGQDPNTCAIMALIAEGCDTRDALIAALPRLVRTSYPHAAVILDGGTGNDPSRHPWYRDDLKRYRLHPAEDVPPAKKRRKRAAPAARHIFDNDVPY